MRDAMIQTIPRKEGEIKRIIIDGLLIFNNKTQILKANFSKFEEIGIGIEVTNNVIWTKSIVEYCGRHLSLLEKLKILFY